MPHDFARTEHSERASDRKFGLVFAALFALLAARPVFSGGTLRLWALALAAALLTAALIRPRLLALPNRLWFRLGSALSRIVNPLVLGIVFVFVVTPTALVMRALGRDPLRLRFDREAHTYWIDRKSAALGVVDMRKQF